LLIDRGGGPDICSAEAFRRFMQTMHEAGQRAGFIDWPRSFSSALVPFAAHERGGIP
jgi:hypothetical protein